MTENRIKNPVYTGSTGCQFTVTSRVINTNLDQNSPINLSPEPPNKRAKLE